MSKPEPLPYGEATRVVPAITHVRIKDLVEKLNDLCFSYRARILSEGDGPVLTVATGPTVPESGVAEQAEFHGVLTARQARLTGSVRRAGVEYRLEFSSARGLEVFEAAPYDAWAEAEAELAL